MYIWNHQGWPHFVHTREAIIPALLKLHYAQGSLDSAIGLLDDDARMQVVSQVLALETLKNSEIEGEHLDVALVRASVTRRLGSPDVPKKMGDREDHAVAILFDAVQDKRPMEMERILSWHESLFVGVSPNARPPQVGHYRVGPVYLLSGRTVGRERIVYEGVPHQRVEEEMSKLFDWIQVGNNENERVVQSALAHLWFVCIHPFSDGNGRLSRTLSEYILAFDHDISNHCYSVSSQIMTERATYYEKLATVSTQNISMDVTEWVIWYVEMVGRAMEEWADSITMTSTISRTVHLLNPAQFNARQIAMLVKLVEGSLYGKLTTSKWAKMTKCSVDSAGRDINALVERGLLVRSSSGGRSTSYDLALDFDEVLQALDGDNEKLS
ncbi:MAG: DUF4172 domain-containing protein [Sphaerochaeta sp.]|nr:DUF4172 domain-containing protein [Sphaerochaeta sp.]